MPANESTALQVNFSLPDRSLINVYAVDGPDLINSLQELADAASTIAETAALLGAVNSAAPVVRPAQPSAVNSAMAGNAAPQQPAYGSPAPVESGLPRPATAEYCAHGEMEWKTGTSAKGNVYGLWSCPTGQKPPVGCEGRWPKRGR